MTGTLGGGGGDGFLQRGRRRDIIGHGVFWKRKFGINGYGFKIANEYLTDGFQLQERMSEQIRKRMSA